jgi:hypothetical protein
MVLFEVFLKRRRFLPLHEKVWQAISPHLAIGAAEDDEVAHRLDCFYYASVVYSAVYQSAVAAGMSTSTAFKLARLHLGKYPFDAKLREAVDAIFPAEEGSRERRYAEQLQATVGHIAAGVAAAAGKTSAADAGGELAGLARFFAGLDFAAGGL